MTSLLPPHLAFSCTYTQGPEVGLKEEAGHPEVDLKGEAGLCFLLLVNKRSYPSASSIWWERVEPLCWVVEVLLRPPSLVWTLLVKASASLFLLSIVLT